MLTFWEMIEMLCKEKGVTPKVMAMRLRINKRTMSGWKSKGIIPRWETLVRLAEYFRVPREQFLAYRQKQTVKDTAYIQKGETL